MSGEIGILFKLFDIFDLFRKVFRVGITEEVLVGGATKPVGLTPQLIREVGVVILQRCLLHIFVGIGGLATEREVAASVSISGLHILVVSFVPWKMGGI